MKIVIEFFYVESFLYCEVRYSQGNHWFLFLKKKKLFKRKLHVLFDCFILFVCLNSKKEIGLILSEGIKEKTKKLKIFFVFNHKIQGKKNIGFHSIAIELLDQIYYYRLSVVCKWLNYGNNDYNKSSCSSTSFYYK